VKLGAHHGGRDETLICNSIRRLAGGRCFDRE
jgi:hypothetical protein